VNYLAHLYLSGNSETLMLGNFVADSVKGGQMKGFSEAVQKGILLHRSIDTYTDQHAVVEESKKRMRQTHGKYAGVIVDIFFDHYLAVRWLDYHKEPLFDYSAWVYQVLKNHHATMPLRAQQFYGYMVSRNILYAYREVAGIDQVLRGMAHRARFVSGMENASEMLLKHYDAFEAEFHAFFPDLEAHVQAKIHSLNEG